MKKEAVIMTGVLAVLMVALAPTLSHAYAVTVSDVQAKQSTFRSDIQSLQASDLKKASDKHLAHLQETVDDFLDHITDHLTKKKVHADAALKDLNKLEKYLERRLVTSGLAKVQDDLNAVANAIKQL